MAGEIFAYHGPMVCVLWCTTEAAECAFGLVAEVGGWRRDPVRHAISIDVSSLSMGE
jgi:hypothetical protein